MYIFSFQNGHGSPVWFCCFTLVVHYHNSEVPLLLCRCKKLCRRPVAGCPMPACRDMVPLPGASPVAASQERAWMPLGWHRCKRLNVPVVSVLCWCVGGVALHVGHIALPFAVAIRRFFPLWLPCRFIIKNLKKFPFQKKCLYLHLKINRRKCPFVCTIDCKCVS